MHVYKIVHGGDFKKNNNFNLTKLLLLCMHSYKFSNAILTDMKTQKRNIMHLILWDRMINVIDNLSYKMFPRFAQIL